MGLRATATVRILLLTYLLRLPLEIKMADSYDLFQLQLKEHIWEMLMEKPD